MKMFLRAEEEARNANPQRGALGFDLEAELATAAKTALKPLAKRLKEYLAEKARLEASRARWSREAYAAKLDSITAAAHAGDEEAAAAIEAGTIPSRESYDQMVNRAEAELEKFHSNTRGLFAEAAALIRGPMLAVVQRGQDILDATLKGLGVPSFKLNGASNAVEYMTDQMERVGRGESGDLATFWEVSQ
jgi:hypothetical protein